MSFAAKYPGRCQDCGERFEAGDQITILHYGTIHADCNAAAPTPERPVTICPKCWLAQPCGCED